MCNCWTHCFFLNEKRNGSTLIELFWVLTTKYKRQISRDIRPKKIWNHCVYKPSVVFYALAGVNALYVNNKFVKKFNSTLSGGSLGLWVDEERSKLRVDMWTAGHMNIDILNAYCGPYWFVSFIRSCMDHTWLRVVRLLNKNCIFITIGCFWQSFLARYTAKIALVNHLEISIYFDTQNTIILFDWKAFKFNTLSQIV